MKHARGPLKALGQNFLIDRGVIEKIVACAEVGPEDYVLEIGPGRGALTEVLAERAGRLVLIEFDHALAADLKRRFANDSRVTIIDADVLTVDLEYLLSMADRWKVVANLPYNISTAVLFRLLDIRHKVSRMVLMLQKEVGDRLVAPPDCKDYGVTTVLLGLWFTIKREFLVRPGSFHPAPKVDSAVLSFVPLAVPRVAIGNPDIFKRVVKGAFAMRRKTLSNCLKGAELVQPEELNGILTECEIDGKRRGETLTLEEFARLSRAFSEACP